MSEHDAIADAYRHCEALTRSQAANFFYGIYLLPRERRQAMCAVYAFARRVDDIGDGSLGQDEKLSRLQAQERVLAGRETDSDPVMVALSDAATRFALPLGALGELIEGVRMDVRGVTYESFDELVPYCRRVAGSIGRCSLAIFGRRHPAPAGPLDGPRLADDLGVAMQLTNILRDLREDAENGRVYLPAEDLRRFGVNASARAPGALSGADSAELDELVRFEAQRAREWFGRGMPLVELLDRRSAACLLAMTGIYRGLLDRIESSPALARRQRLSLPSSQKAWVAVRSLLGAAT